MAAKKTASEAKKADHANIYEALLAACKEIDLLKDAKGNYGSYGSLPQILADIREALANQGLLLIQPISYSPAKTDPSGLFVESFAVQRTVLVHAKTEKTIESELPIKLDQGSQQIGANITYFRRYLALANLGLAPRDLEDLDDSGSRSILVDKSVQAVKDKLGDAKGLPSGFVENQANKLRALASKNSKAPETTREAIDFAYEMGIASVGFFLEKLPTKDNGQEAKTGPDPLLEGVVEGKVDPLEMPITPLPEKGD